jgi:N-acetylglutamate synthase-like GNAT family acetyltransferase
VEVRRAASRDVPGLAVLLEQLGYPTSSEGLEGRLERLDSDLYVAADGGEVLGLAALQVMHVLQHDTPSARLTALVVREDARGRGVARALVIAIESAAREAGCERLHVTTANHRADAHAAYRALGFEDTGRRYAKRL